MKFVLAASLADEIADVNEHLIRLQQAKDLDKEQFEQQLQQLRTEYQETKDHITSENLVLGKQSHHQFSLL